MAKRYTPNPNNEEAAAALTDTVGLIPPQSVELEEAVLGALMLEKDAVIEIQGIITPEAFYKEAHQIIYKAIMELSMELKPIDLYTVTEKLKQTRKLSAVGGAAYLAQLTQKVGSAAHIEFHSKIIAQKFVQRELIRAATEIQKKAYDESMDVTDLIDLAEGEIFKVSEGHVKRDVQKSRDILTKTLLAIEEASKREGGFSGVPTGFTHLDRLTLGWQPSDLIIIAARPSMGKTAFVLSLARNVAVDFEKGVAFFSLEMSAEQLATRILSEQAEIASRLCLSGPHKDDLEVLVNGRSARQFCSQGQVRTAALALKLADREIHKNTMGEYPIMLLDDVLSELDPRRQEYVLNRIAGGQVFITCCENDRLDTLLSGKVFHIRGGEVLT